MVGIFIVFLLTNVVWIVFSLLLIATLRDRPISRMLAPKKQDPNELGPDEKYEDATNDQLIAELGLLGERYKRNRVTSSEDEPVE